MEKNILIYLVLGTALFGMTFLPRLLERHPLTLPLIYVGAGIMLFSLPLGLEPLRLVWDSEDRTFVEYFTEILVIISLAGAGLKIDREFSWRSWSVGWRLLGIAMPLTIAIVALMGVGWFALAPSAAILLGAALAPTDPVLAEDVQVSAPHEGREDDVRFGLTLEAGLNDALAFPFVYLAIAMAAYQGSGGWVGEWFAMDVVYRCAAGLGMGFLAGKLLSRYLMNHSDVTQQTEKQQKEGSEGLFIISAILLSYSVTEIVGGYGFLAVFVAAVVGKRSSAEEHNRSTFRFVSQIERLMLAAMLIGFGGMLTAEKANLTDWRVWVAAGAIVFVIRPAVGMLSLVFTGLPKKHRMALAFFGIRGVGTIYYLAYALRKAPFEEVEMIWSIVAATVSLSLLVHGLTASRVMRSFNV